MLVLMNLLRTSFLNAIAVSIKMLAMLGINKVLAIYLGPVGYAAIGQFQNAIQMVNNFCGLAAGAGVTKYTAQYHADPERQRRTWQTAGTLTLLLSLIVALVIVIFKAQFSQIFFGTKSYSDVCVWLAASIVFSSLNFFLLAILNGRKEIEVYVMANIGGSLLSLILIVAFVIWFGLRGALVAMATYQAFSFVVTLYLVRRTAWFGGYLFIGIPRISVMKDLGKYAAMALAASVCSPVSQLAVRSYVGETLGWASAGNWEAMWRLSSAYLLLVTTTLAIYFLPRFSEIEGPEFLRKELLQGFRSVLPLCALCAVGIYVSRDVIIWVLFSNGFTSMRELFAWQLIGDWVKVSGLMLGYMLQAKAFWKFFIFSEFVASIVFYFMVVTFVSEYGLVGVSMGYAAANAIYFLIIFVFLWRNLLGANKEGAK